MRWSAQSTCRRGPLGLFLCIFALTIPLASGCAVNQGSDALVVNAERGLKVSFTTVDTFLKIESENHGDLVQQLPEVAQFAETLRATAPDRFREAKAAIDAYKSARTGAAGDNLNSKLAMIEALAKQAREYIVRIEARRPGTGEPVPPTGPPPPTG